MPSIVVEGPDVGFESGRRATLGSRLISTTVAGFIVSADGSHDRIIAAAARSTLAALGFRRKGRSRIWLADRGYWLSIVSFQPSGFAKGSYLDVAAHWLWGPRGEILSLDYVLENARPWIEFENVEHFTPLAFQFAQQAADESRLLEAGIGDIHSLAAMLVARENDRVLNGAWAMWPAFNAAVAAGVSGDLVTASTWLKDVSEALGRSQPDVQRLLAPYIASAGDVSEFRAFTIGTINDARARYGLNAIDEIR